MSQKVPLREDDEELKMLLEVAKRFEDARKQKGRELTRSEKTELSGKATEDIIQKHLLEKNLNVSDTRVHIAHDKIKDMEIDLLLLKPKVDRRKIIYLPDEVDTVFEIKNNAVTDQATKTKANFDRLKENLRTARFVFVCLSERTTYKHRVTEEKLRYPVFELISRIRSRGPWMESQDEIIAESHRTTRTGEPAMWKTGSWNNLIDYLRK
ncbi:MAG: hypothetical protein QXJ02_04295 [Candidatus Bathyarchaeia archaeon]